MVHSLRMSIQSSRQSFESLRDGKGVATISTKKRECLESGEESAVYAYVCQTFRSLHVLRIFYVFFNTNFSCNKREGTTFYKAMEEYVQLMVWEYPQVVTIYVNGAIKCGIE